MHRAADPYLYDNRYVADCLARYPTTFSGIAIMDRNAPDAVERLERLVGEDGFEGLRMHLGRAEDPAEWAAPDQDPIWRKAEELAACMLSLGSVSSSRRSLRSSPAIPASR